MNYEIITNGGEADVILFPDCVVKIYRQERTMEQEILKEVSSDFFVKPFVLKKRFIILERLGNVLGGSELFHFKEMEDIDPKKLIDWLEGLDNELVRLNFAHRDINPRNICRNGESFKLIDFTYGIIGGGEENRKLDPKIKRKRIGQSSYTDIDWYAISKMIKEIKEYYKL